MSPVLLAKARRGGDEAKCKEKKKMKNEMKWSIGPCEPGASAYETAEVSLERHISNPASLQS